MNGNPVHGERVVIVEVNSGRVNLKSGRISSTDSSHVQADNRNKTVVWDDLQYHPVTDGLDDTYEKTYEVQDIHLLKEHEAQSLQDLETARNWFGTIYQDRVVAKIQRALKRLKLA